MSRFLTDDYLYGGFDALVKSLEAPEKNPLDVSIKCGLIDLIESLAADSRYNNYASANWMRYSARCFYCADYLLKYINNLQERDRLIGKLNSYFMELVESGVAPIIPEETLNKYIRKNVNESNAKNLYGLLIHKAVNECGCCRYWQSNDASLACSYTQSIRRLLMDYVSTYSDLTVLKEWLPTIGTVRLAKIWYDYPDSPNYNHTDHYSRESIMKSLDMMLDIHLELFSFWYKHNSQEVIETLSTNDLIEIMEVTDDDDFECMLRQAVALPWNEKVEGVLRHFTEDDEQWIVNLSRKLLSTY